MVGKQILDVRELLRVVGAQIQSEQKAIDNVLGDFVGEVRDQSELLGGQFASF